MLQAFAPLIYMLTATERTQAARFWIFALLLATLIIELSLVSTAHRFHYSLSSAQFDALRANIRYALSCLSCLSLLLSVLTHKDYGQLAYTVSRESRVHLDNNHRMLHELLRRTKSLSPPPKSGSSAAFQPNAFQSRAPPRDHEEDEPQIEGVKRALTPRKAERLSMDSTAGSSADGSWVDWRQIDPNTCGCPGHAPPKPSMFSFISPKHARSHSNANTTTGGGGHARTGSNFSTAAPAAAASPSTSSTTATRHARTASTTPAAAAAAAALSPEPGVQFEGEDEYDDAEEEQEEGAQKQSQDAAAGVRARSPRASSRSRSPSPSASPLAASAAAAYAAPSRVTRSASRSQSVSNPANMRAAAARLSTTPLRKSAGPKFLGGGGGAGHETAEEGEDEAQQPGEETPSKAKGAIKKGAAARRKS